MKRLVLLLAALVALGAVVASTAAGHIKPVPKAPALSLTLAVTPADLVLPAGEEAMDVTVGGTFVDGHWNLVSHHVTVYYYANGACTGEAYHSWSGIDTAKKTGTFTGPTLPLPVGTYSFLVTHEADQFVPAAHMCLKDVTVSPTPEAPVVPTPPPAIQSDHFSSSFLCWNKEMVNPVAYLDYIADQMWLTGNYFEPQAILGNVEGGTNLGAYHLVCNAPATMKATGEVLGGSGDVYSAEISKLYHAEHPGLNDLNVYHIYK